VLTFAPRKMLGASVSEGGAGGIRTLVQTRKTKAFYKFSFNLFFDFMPARNNQQ